jgi:hypothetical protein
VKRSFSELWQETPWGSLWIAAILVMIGVFVGMLFDGFGLGTAIVFGVMCGPGFTAVMGLAGIILSYFWPPTD